MRHSIFAVAALAVSAASMPAHAMDDVIQGSDFDKILAIAKGYGQAERADDDSGKPKLSGKMGGISYTVNFFNCDDDYSSCRTMLFQTWWVGDDLDLDLEKVNGFNSEATFGRAFIDSDGDLAVDMPVNINFGLKSDTMDDNFDWWRVVVNSVRDTLVEPNAK